jgi:hypothetical protein
VADKGWSREFDEPISLPDGRSLTTLRDAADYITGLPKKEAAAPEWQAAIERVPLQARSARKLTGLSRHVSHHGEAVAAFVPVPPLCQGPRR